MNHRNAAVVAALTLAVACGIVPPPPVHGATASVPSDFNGDGYSDLAVGVPGQDLGASLWDAGQVNVLYGSSTGLTAAGDQVWTQGSPGIKGVPEGRIGDEDGEDRIPGDRFGQVLASGDFDGDGYADLAVTAPGDRVNGELVGAVNVIYGGPSGLNERGDQLFSPANLTGAIAGVGRNLETGDFDGDGYADLALSVGRLDQATHDGQSDRGVMVLRGSASGLTLADSTSLWLGLLGLPPDTGPSGFGGPLAAGDADGDGADELAIGMPHLSVGTKVGVGAAAVIPGTHDGLDVAQAETFSQDTPGLPGEAISCDPGDACVTGDFGSVLEFGDFSGDGYDDLAVGSPYESAAASAEGAVVILLGGASGLSGIGGQVWMQGTPGVPGNGEYFDQFGASLVAADFDADGRTDLAIGTPDEGFAGVLHAGVVTVLRGAVSGLTATGAQQWSQNSDGVPGRAEESDLFGATLAAGNFGRSARPDLVVGVREEQAGGLDRTGVVDVLYARSGGLSGSGGQSWWLDSPGIKGLAQRESFWATALAAR